MFDGEIKSSRYIKKIKVNDNDDYIEINLNDSELLENYTNMVQEISNYSKSEVLNEETEVNSDDIEETINSIKKSLSIHKKIAETVDKYIGEGTCVKVFGVKYPTADSVFEFLVILFVLNTFDEVVLFLLAVVFSFLILLFSATKHGTTVHLVS